MVWSRHLFPATLAPPLDYRLPLWNSPPPRSPHLDIYSGHAVCWQPGPRKTEQDPTFQPRTRLPAFPVSFGFASWLFAAFIPG